MIYRILLTIVAESKVYLSRQVKRNLAKAIDIIQYIEIGSGTAH